MKRNRSKKIILLFLSLGVFFSVMFGTLFLRSTRAETGCVTITVQYIDGYPRSDAIIETRIHNIVDWDLFAETNASGIAIVCDYLAPGFYDARAWFPNLASPFGPHDPYVMFEVDANGNGNTTISEDYKSLTIHSPENTTYTSPSVPLNFTFHNSSVVSWMGYSLNNQPNTPITNPIITDLGDNGILVNITIQVSNGQHNITVYATDINGHTGSSDTIDFTVQTSQPVGGISIPVDKLELFAPYIGLTVLLAAVVLAVVYVKRRKRHTEINS